MTSGNKITINRGDTHTLHLAITSAGQPFDLTDCIVSFTAKTDLSQTDAQAQIAKTIDTYVAPESGELDIELTSDDTDTAGDYYYDVQIRYADGSLTSSRRGRLVIEQDVTFRIS